MTFFLIFCAQIARFNVILEPFQEVCIHRPLCTYFHLKGQLVQILAGAARWGGRGWVQFRWGKGKKGREVGWFKLKMHPRYPGSWAGGKRKGKTFSMPSCARWHCPALPSLPLLTFTPALELCSAASKLGSKSCRVWGHLLLMCLGEIKQHKVTLPCCWWCFLPIFSGLCPSPCTLQVKYLPATHWWMGI